MVERLTDRNNQDGIIIREMYERLLAYEDTGLTPEEIIGLCSMDRRSRMAKMLRLEEAENNGRLIVLPCKVGDMLYEVDLPKYGVITCEVLHIGTYNGPSAHVPGNPMVSAVSVGVEVVEGHGKGSGYAFELEDFGENVFLTREEAEAALQKREADDEANRC